MIRLKKEKIKEKIALTGYSVRAWGDRYGFSQGTLSNWLTGKRQIKRSSLEKLAEALRCKMEDIAEIVWVVDGKKIERLEADREEITGIFGSLNADQRQAVIVVAQAIADANREQEG